MSVALISPSIKCEEPTVDELWEVEGFQLCISVPFAENRENPNILRTSHVSGTLIVALLSDARRGHILPPPRVQSALAEEPQILQAEPGVVRGAARPQVRRGRREG